MREPERLIKDFVLGKVAAESTIDHRAGDKGLFAVDLGQIYCCIFLLSDVPRRLSHCSIMLHRNVELNCSLSKAKCMRHEEFLCNQV